MEINNYNTLLKLLDFDGDSYYFLQIIKRKKDNPSLHKNNVMLKQYQVDSLKFLNEKMESIIELCKKENARAMLDINKRSFLKTALITQKLITEYMLNSNCKASRLAYQKACGNKKVISEKRKQRKWIVDVDSHGGIPIEMITQNYIDSIISVNGKTPDLFIVVPSPNGNHIITNPFNFDLFMRSYPIMAKSIKKNNPTILYAP